MSLSTISTVEEAKKAYYRRTEARFSYNTLKNRRVSVSQFLEHIGLVEEDAAEQLEEVGQYHIEDWIDEQLLDGYASRTVRNKVYCVSSFFGFLKERQVVEANPCEDVDTSNYTENKIDDYTESRYIEIEEYKEMLRHTHKKRNEILLRLLWQTGIRASEAVDLQREQIYLEDRKLRVINAKSSETDSERKRWVYIDRTLSRLIKKWYEGERKAYLGTDGSEDNQHLLVTKQAPQMAVNRVTEIVNERATEADIQQELYTTQDGRGRDKITAHAFRHSYCVHRVKEGMPLVYLQNLVGHTDISQTREYLHFREDDTEEAERNYRPRVRV